MILCQGPEAAESNCRTDLDRELGRDLYRELGRDLYRDLCRELCRDVGREVDTRPVPGYS
jgi:hypothetical protein